MHVEQSGKQRTNLWIVLHDEDSLWHVMEHVETKPIARQSDYTTIAGPFETLDVAKAAYLLIID